MEARIPHQYIMRCMFGDGYRTVEFRVWAYSAEDAKLQTELGRKGDSDFKGIAYIGPVNPNCQCLNQCHCGTNAVPV